MGSILMFLFNVFAITVLGLVVSFLLFMVFVIFPLEVWKTFDPRIGPIVDQIAGRVEKVVSTWWENFRPRQWYSKKIRQLYNKIVLGERDGK